MSTSGVHQEWAPEKICITLFYPTALPPFLLNNVYWRTWRDKGKYMLDKAVMLFHLLLWLCNLSQIREPGINRSLFCVCWFALQIFKSHVRHFPVELKCMFGSENALLEQSVSINRLPKIKMRSFLMLKGFNYVFGPGRCCSVPTSRCPSPSLPDDFSRWWWSDRRISQVTDCIANKTNIKYI